jgi:endonuclease/exonuclease/phosphatase family metal-dependent hydrolase
MGMQRKRLKVLSFSYSIQPNQMNITFRIHPMRQDTMKKNFAIIIAFAVTILFFIQLAGTLVESIYILDLMNLQLDARALGVLFFFAPVLLFPLFKKFSRQTAWTMGAILLVARGVLPYLGTSSRMLAAGLGVVAALSLLFLLLSRKPGGLSASRLGAYGAAGLGLAVVLSVFLRTWGYGVDISLMRAGGWAGWVLGLVLLIVMLSMQWGSPTPVQGPVRRITSSILGVLLIIDLIWFSFSAPAVIARWTESNYTLIVGMVSLLTAITAWICIARPQWLVRIRPTLLLTWNALFTLSLTGTILAQRVAFPATPASAPVVVTSPSLAGQVALVLTLVSFPVLLIDLRLFITQIAQAVPTARELVPGFLLGMLLTIFFIFANIFSNVWGYVPPVSPYFRGTFWLTFFLMAAGISLLAWLAREPQPEIETLPESAIAWGWGSVFAFLVIATLVRSVPTGRIQVDAADRTSLLFMTYNIQQGSDHFAQKSIERQLALIRKISPDIVSLQESDTARISMNNSDIVRYFAEQLGYYSYYGPRTVTGTYGTAILSKYPLENTRAIFSYSDTDEIGTTAAEIEVNGRRFTIYDVHPAGSDTADLAFATMLVEQSQDHPYVIALGDYNLRDYEKAYQMIDSVYTNAWTSVYPSEISPDGVDMSGDNRIDHIFMSAPLYARNPVYILPPESATDHPAHWAEIDWEAP